jgi:hypothetical protein
MGHRKKAGKEHEFCGLGIDTSDFVRRAFFDLPQ